MHSHVTQLCSVTLFPRVFPSSSARVFLERLCTHRQQMLLWLPKTPQVTKNVTLADFTAGGLWLQVYLTADPIGPHPQQLQSSQGAWLTLPRNWWMVVELFPASNVSFVDRAGLCGPPVLHKVQHAVWAIGVAPDFHANLAYLVQSILKAVL